MNKPFYLLDNLFYELRKEVKRKYLFYISVVPDKYTFVTWMESSLLSHLCSLFLSVF